MKGLVAAGIAFVVLAAPAYAAKSVAKKAKPVPQTIAAPAPAFTWTGCYVGGHIGGGWGHKNFSNPTGFELSDGSPAFTPPPPLYPGTSTVSLPLDQHVSGFLGGAQVGCKYQFASKWVVGIDAAFSKSRLIGTTAWNLTPFGTAPPIIVPATLQAEVDWLASTTAILGYSFDRLLLYGKGGVAWVHDNYDFLIIPPDLSFAGPPLSLVGAADFRESEIRTGWTAGIGLEYAFSKNLSAKIEYDYYDFGSKNVVFTNQFPTGASPFGNATIKQNIQTITFGLNYYFWNPASPTPAATPLITKAPVATAGPPPADNAASAITWTQTFSSEARYDSWRSNRPFPAGVTTPGGNALLPAAGSGSEFYTPYATQLTGQTNDWKIELLGRGGWVEAHQTTAGFFGQVQTATDTVASATITYLGMQGLQPFAAVEMNLPTGLASLPANAVAAQMDPDLVDISTFGEGFNIGPTLGFNLPITNSLLITLSAGYTHRGTFVRQSTLTPPTPPAPMGVPAKIDPGDVLTGTVSVGYQVGQLTTKLTGTISQQTSTTNVNDIPFLRAGRTYLAAGTWSYAWSGDNVGVTMLTASASHANRNEVMFQCLEGFGCPTTLVTEPFNTNSNLYRVGLEHLFAVGQVAYGPIGSFLFRDANGYVPTTLQFVPAKQRWSAGAQAKYAPTNTLVFNARVERVWIHANETPALPNNTTFSVLADTPVPSFTVPVVSGNGWQFVVGATASF